MGKNLRFLSIFRVLTHPATLASWILWSFHLKKPAYERKNFREWYHLVKIMITVWLLNDCWIIWEFVTFYFSWKHKDKFMLSQVSKMNKLAYIYWSGYVDLIFLNIFCVGWSRIVCIFIDLLFYHSNKVV